MDKYSQHSIKVMAKKLQVSHHGKKKVYIKFCSTISIENYLQKYIYFNNTSFFKCDGLVLNKKIASTLIVHTLRMTNA